MEAIVIDSLIGELFANIEKAELESAQCNLRTVTKDQGGDETAPSSHYNMIAYDRLAEEVSVD